MNTFADYAEYYDLFYSGKDYAGEAAFVGRLVRRHAQGAGTMLDLGCGTGRHAREFVRKGWQVCGVDRSAKMVKQARKDTALLPASLRSRLRFERGDVSRMRRPEKFDAVVALFHVIDYQTTNAALLGTFKAARSALRPGGVFVFDFWYGPAVLSERPVRRARTVRNREFRVRRIAEPVHDVNRNIVKVKYALSIVRRGNGARKEIRETHAMRYLFLPEIELLAGSAGFRLVETGEWLTRKPLHERCWSGYAIARAEAARK